MSHLPGWQKKGQKRHIVPCRKESVKGGTTSSGGEQIPGKALLLLLLCVPSHRPSDFSKDTVLQHESPTGPSVNGTWHAKPRVFIGSHAMGRLLARHACMLHRTQRLPPHTNNLSQNDTQTEETQIPPIPPSLAKHHGTFARAALRTISPRSLPTSQPGPSPPYPPPSLAPDDTSGRTPPTPRPTKTAAYMA